jgi:mannitol 2-dehydrogenase
VLEDSFCDGRPPFERVGVQLVADVAPYEAIKLRVLNASHTAVAYLSALAGIEYIHEAVAHPLLRQFLQQLMSAEVLPNLSAPAGSNMSVAAYADKVLERFSNPALADQTSRIVLDGSGKMPKFVLPSLMAQIHAGKQQSTTLLTLVIASWLRFLSGVDDAGRSYRIDDPLAAPLQAAAAQELAESAAAAAAGQPNAEPTSLLAFLGRAGVLSPELLGSADFRAQITTHLHMLRTRGALDTLKTVLSQTAEKK